MVQIMTKDDLKEASWINKAYDFDIGGHSLLSVNVGLSDVNQVVLVV